MSNNTAVVSRKVFKPGNGSCGRPRKSLEGAPPKRKRIKIEGQEEIKLKSKSKNYTLRPEWPKHTQEELKDIFGSSPKRMTFVFEDSSDSEDEDVSPVEECKQTNAMVEKLSKEEKPETSRISTVVTQ